MQKWQSVMTSDDARLLETAAANLLARNQELVTAASLCNDQARLFKSEAEKLFATYP